MKTLYLESIAGIAGDMFSASFLDAGLVSKNELVIIPEKLHLSDVKIIISEVIRSNLRATHIDVQCDKTTWFHHHSSSHHASHNHPENHHHVPFVEIDKFIKHSSLDDEVITIASQILDTLAVAEAKCHGQSKETVEFHELGTIDSVIDIVMAAYCIAKVKPQTVIASPIKLGRGQINTSHGMLPVPPPVSANLAMEMPLDAFPVAIQEKNIELSTPTGLAILKNLNPTFSSGWPEGKILAQGQGAGSMNLENYPNLFRVCLLETQENTEIELPYLQDSVMEITANYDDTSPEYLSWAAGKLFACGAIDVWQTMSIGKKGRVMIILSVLVPLSHWSNCVDFILKKTSTFGLRYKKLDRFILARHFEKRETDNGVVQIKVGSNTKGIKLKEKFEFEEIKQILDSN